MSRRSLNVREEGGVGPDRHRGEGRGGEKGSARDWRKGERMRMLASRGPSGTQRVCTSGEEQQGGEASWSFLLGPRRS